MLPKLNRIHFKQNYMLSLKLWYIPLQLESQVMLQSTPDTSKRVCSNYMHDNFWLTPY